MKALLAFRSLFLGQAKGFALALILSLVTLAAGVALLGTSGWFITAAALTTAGPTRPCACCPSSAAGCSPGCSRACPSPIAACAMATWSAASQQMSMRSTPPSSSPSAPSWRRWSLAAR